MADDLSVVNGARVSFAKRKEEMNDADAGLIRFLMRDRHGSPVRAQRVPLPHSLPDLRRPRVVSSSHRLPDGGHADHVRGHQRPTRTCARRSTSSAPVGRANATVTRCPGRRGRIRASQRGRSQRTIASDWVGRAALDRLAGAAGLRDARWRVRRMRCGPERGDATSSRVGHIGDVIDKGVQPVYRLTLEDGKQITMTENHRVLTDERLGDDG